MFTPQWPFLDLFRAKDKEYKRTQKLVYDQQDKTRTLDPLLPRTGDELSHVILLAETPRSYIVATPDGELTTITWRIPQ